MMRARRRLGLRRGGAGVHAEAASYPAEVGERLGADVCTLARADRRRPAGASDGALTDETSPLLGRLAGSPVSERALLAAIGDGTRRRGALLVLRGADDDAWSGDERDGARRRSAAGSAPWSTSSRRRRRDRQLVDELRGSTSTAATWSPRSPMT